MEPTFILLAAIYIGLPGQMTAVQQTIEFHQSKSDCEDAKRRFYNDYAANGRGWVMTCTKIQYGAAVPGQKKSKPKQ